MSDRIEIFTQMRIADPENPMVLFGLANEYMKAAQFEEAIGVFEEYLRFKTDEGAAYGMLARAYENTGQPGKAEEAYRTGIQVSLAHGHPSMAEEYRQTLEDDYS